MLMTLIKKQFYEVFRGYFINPKTGKARSKKGIIGMFIFFAAVMIVVGFSFFAMTLSMTALIGTEIEWLFFAMFGILAISLGVFASVFTTYSSLYLSKDNDLLLSMPLRPVDILLSRIALVYGLAFVYSATAWIPAIISASLTGKMRVISVVFCFILLFIIPLFVSALACVLGWLLAQVSSKVKNKSIITIVLSITFLALYYMLVFKLSDFFESFLLYSSEVANSVKTWGNIFYHLGNGAVGNVLSLIIFILISCLLFGIVLYVLSRSYTKILTRSTSGKIQKTAVKYSSSKNVVSSLLKKEWLRFISLPTYVLNCSLGAFFALGFAVYCVIKRNDLMTLSVMIQEEISDIALFIPVILVAMICMLLSMNTVSTPSISLEGKNLWILKSLPVKASDVLSAKIYLHVAINAIPGIISTAVIGWCLHLDYQTIISCALIVYFFVYIQAMLGLLLGLYRPNFTWTNVTQPIKQSMNVLIMMLVNALISVAIVGIFFLLNTKTNIDVSNYLMYTFVGLAIIALLIKRILFTKGVELFEKL